MQNFKPFWLKSVFAIIVLLAVCSATKAEVVAEPLFGRKQVPPPSDRIHIEKRGNLTVAAAVPSLDETIKIFGLDLYRKNIQPVWVQVENRSSSTVYLTPLSLDAGYFTAREAASRSRKKSLEPLAHKFETPGFVRFSIAAGSIVSGYIFTRVDEGTKSFNVDVIEDGKPRMMSFFIPVPGLRLDHHEVEVGKIYPESEIKSVDLPELVAALESMPCCVRDKKGGNTGDPLNLVLVGEIKDIYYSFMRAGWDETEIIYGGSLLKTAKSALIGGDYRYSPVSALYLFGRPQDTAMQKARDSIHQRNHLRIWLTPLRHDGIPVWIGQISRDIGVRFTWQTITTHKIDPNVDETREFLVEDLAYSQALKAFGYVGGVGLAPYSKPRANLTGDPYFTDGRRIVMWLSGEPTAIDELQLIDLSPYHTDVVSD
jgi:hypothetical protein